MTYDSVVLIGSSVVELSTNLSLHVLIPLIELRKDSSDSFYFMCNGNTTHTPNKDSLEIHTLMI